MNTNYSNTPYGWDRFSKVMVIGGLLLLTSKWSVIFGIAAIAYAIWRTRSKNTMERRKEAVAYETFERNFAYKINSSIRRLRAFRLKDWMNKRKDAREDRKANVIVACPACGQKLRLPRGKGRIVVTCARCSEEFRIKT